MWQAVATALAEVSALEDDLVHPLYPCQIFDNDKMNMNEYLMDYISPTDHVKTQFQHEINWETDPRQSLSRAW